MQATDGQLQEPLLGPMATQEPPAHDDLVPAGGQTSLLHEEQLEAAIDDLFTTPAPSLVPQQQQRRPRQRRTFDMTAVRRSARLAKRPVLPAVERAQRNLCRKLGISDDEMKPIEEILQDFISTFSGPLPDHIMAAMTALFNLEDDNDDLVHDALLQHAGEDAADLHHELVVADA